MAKADMKICRYKDCKHPDKKIDTQTDDYIHTGSLFFHADCYKQKTDEEEKKKRESADMQLIKNLWIEHISQTVVISALFKVLREYLDRGVSSDYLVFVMQYVIKNKCKLNYPMGFRYYIDNDKIKAAYRSKINQSIPKDAFVVTEPQEDKGPANNISLPRKPKGFSSILGGRK